MVQNHFELYKIIQNFCFLEVDNYFTKNLDEKFDNLKNKLYNSNIKKKKVKNNEIRKY
jgi:hypothetical protein